MNHTSENGQSKLTLPNCLSGFRFVATPILLWSAWHSFSMAFLVILALAFLSDALDGLVARLTGQVTQFGAKLDSWGDMIMYLTIALCAWWLWPEIVRREALYIGMVIASYIMPAIVGIIKFGSFTSYHTWTVKLAAVCMGMTYYVLFLGGPAWPFRVAALICIVASVEEIAISLLLSETETNVRSVWDVIKRSNRRSRSDSKQFMD